jgi:hypothetical protein
VMTANGIFRELALKRMVASRPADTVSAALGILLITVVSVVGLRPLVSSGVSLSQRAQVSIALIVLTVLFETALGIFVDHKTSAELIEHYAIWHGNLWPLVLTWLAYMPFANA